MVSVQAKMGHSPDANTNNILGDAFGPRPSLQTSQSSEMPKNTGMNFVGSVTKTPGMGCLPLATVWGCSFFVEPSSFQCFSHESFVPAWMVPINDKDATMEVHQRVDNFKFTYTPVKKKVEEVVPVTIYYLTPMPHVVGEKGVSLSRRSIAEMTKVAAVQFKIEKKVNTGAVSGEEAKRNNIWAACKHLFS